MSIFSCEAARKRVKHAEMRMKWRVNCNFVPCKGLCYIILKK